jgi:hypothetical protein
MGRTKTGTPPTYRRHRATDQAVVTIGGRDIYLGAYDTPASKAEYPRLIAEHAVTGRVSIEPADANELLVKEVLAAFWRFAKVWYVKNGLPTVEGLRRGRCACGEPAPIMPVDLGTVESTIRFLPQVTADMVRFQLLTGPRPGEVVSLVPADIDRSGDVWEYFVDGHKTEHHGRSRTVYIGPDAQRILTPYLLRDPHTVCFSMAESLEQRRSAGPTLPEPDIFESLQHIMYVTNGLRSLVEVRIKIDWATVKSESYQLKVCSRSLGQLIKSSAAEKSSEPVPDDLVTLLQAAAYCRVSKRTLEDWKSQGHLPDADIMRKRGLSQSKHVHYRVCC